MLNRRKSVIGYVTYVVATRVAKRVVRQRAQRMRKSAAATAGRASGRPLPLVGGALAVAAGVALLALRGRRSSGD